ncbi:MAG: CHAT domain-containing protein, partial [Bacteroidota bacterium]
TLQEHLNKHNLTDFAGITEEVRLAEESMRMKISHQQRIYQGLSNKREVDPAKVNKISRTLFDLYVSYDSLIEEIERNYPEYYALRYQIPAVDIEEIQRQLPEKQGIVSYFVGEESAFSWFITKDQAEMYTLPSPDSIQAALQAYSQHFEPENMRTLLLASKAQQKNHFDAFLTQGHQLYRQLMMPVEDQFVPGMRLTIVPDSYLGYLAFETLPRFMIKGAEADYRKVPYLIKDFAIGYTPSISLHLNLQGQIAPSNSFYNYVGFAPVFPHEEQENGDSLLAMRSDFYQNLPFAKEEVEQVATLLRGKTFLGPSATVKNFIKEAPKGRIIHIASHSILEDLAPLDSRLIFSPEDETSALTLAEVYNLQMEAELVVLSSCESGKGVIAKGEGIMSLSRAFFYAGSRSALITLWEVEDRAAKDILYPFFEQLQAQESKTVALQKAKLDYITYVGEASFAHPFFWGPFVMVGNQAPVELSAAFFLNYAIFGTALFLVLLLMGYTFYTYQRRKKSSTI